MTLHTSRRPMIVGNWKMNTTIASAVELAGSIRKVSESIDSHLEIVIAPPFTALSAVAQVLESTSPRIALAAQNCHHQPSGAFTGEVSVPMLADIGCTYVIVGHSERRHGMGESEALIGKKVDALLDSRLVPIICVGERLEERERDETLTILKEQLHAALCSIRRATRPQIVIAYEPVWAIGTEKSASAKEAQTAHHFLRSELRALVGEAANRVQILYGGSVKPNNIKELVSEPDVDGALVGGASLEIRDFQAIVEYTAD